MSIGKRLYHGFDGIFIGGDQVPHKFVLQTKAIDAAEIHYTELKG